jgi:hypothetical protein
MIYLKKKSFFHLIFLLYIYIIAFQGTFIKTRELN